jgi:predicted secreted protein
MAVWIVVLIVVANWAVPVFANVGSGPQCTLSACPRTATTVEWVPILITGAVAATVTVGVLWGLRKALSQNS